MLGELDTPRGALDLLRTIHNSDPEASPWQEDVPVIVLSPTSQEPDLLRAFEAGADDFWARPADTWSYEHDCEPSYAGPSAPRTTRCSGSAR